MAPQAEFHTPEGCFINELSNADADPEASIARARVPPGITTRWHRLNGTTERYVLVSGAGRMEVGNLPPQDIGPGDVVLIPPGCRQRITSVGDEDLVFLAVCTPRYRSEAYEDVDPAPASDPSMPRAPLRSSSPPTDERASLWRRVTELWELAVRKDEQQIRDALHPDYAGWDTNALLPHDREAAVRSVAGTSARITDFSLDPSSVRVYGGTVGVVHYSYSATVESGDSTCTHITGKWTEIYQKHGHRWLMVAVSGRPTVGNKESVNDATAT
jgi:mannose-6-phosphate isomerase-like protein (cupin superfamily)